MADRRFEAFQLDREFVLLENDGKLTGLPVDDNFWREAPGRSCLQSRRLMGIVQIDRGASHWEIHPGGDELLHLLSGTMEVVIESPGKNRSITLVPLSSCIVPGGSWHQTMALEPCRLLFITPGKDTRHRK